MPHTAEPRTRTDDRTDRPPADTPTPTALATRKCPSCGREAAVVFPFCRAAAPPAAAAPLVCPACCPRPGPLFHGGPP